VITHFIENNLPDRLWSDDLTDLAAYKWVRHGSTNEYYCLTLANAQPIPAAPSFIKLDSLYATQGTPGSLAAGQWGWGNVDSLGFNTLYARLADDASPQTKALGYVLDSGHRVPSTAYTNITLQPLYYDLLSAAYKWTQSTANPNEYFCEAAAGGTPRLRRPTLVETGRDTTVLIRGTAGSLLEGEWGYGRTDGQAYDTIYARITGNASPAGLSYLVGKDPDYFPTTAKSLSLRLINEYTAYATYAVTASGATGDTSDRRIGAGAQQGWWVNLNNEARQVCVYCDSPATCRLIVVGWGEKGGFVDAPTNYSVANNAGWVEHTASYPTVPSGITASGSIHRMRTKNSGGGGRGPSSNFAPFYGPANSWVGAPSRINSAYNPPRSTVYGGSTGWIYAHYGYFDASEWVFDPAADLTELAVDTSDLGNWYGADTGKVGSATALIFIQNTALSCTKLGAVRSAAANDNFNTFAGILSGTNYGGGYYSEVALDELGRFQYYRETADIKFYLVAWTPATVQVGTTTLSLESPAVTATGAALAQPGTATLALESPAASFSGAAVVVVDTTGLNLVSPAVTALGAALVVVGTTGINLVSPAVTARGAARASVATTQDQLVSPAVTVISTHGTIVEVLADTLALESPTVTATGAALAQPGAATLALLSPSVVIGAGQQILVPVGASVLQLISPAVTVQAGQQAGCLVFQLGTQSILISCGRVYPVREPKERLQVVSRTAGGTIRVVDKGVKVRTIVLTFKDLRGSDYAALDDWYDNVAVGAFNAFSFVDELGLTYTVRWMSTLDFQETANNRYGGDITLERVD
jgi:hypothetical protein